MKKLLVFLTAAVMLLVLGCAKAPAEPVNIAALKGPTGMGISYLMQDTNQYSVELQDAPDVVVGKFVSGEIDIAAVPINLAATLYNKTEGNVVMLNLDTLGVLYILENGDSIHSLSDLAGKTVYASGEGATPQFVIDYLLAQNGLTDQVTVQYVGEHTALAAMVASGEADIALLPEPFVSAVTVKNPDVRVALDLNEAWEAASGTKLVMGVYIASRTFYDEHPDQVKQFLKDYAASVEKVNTSADAAQTIADLGIVGSADIAAQAIPRSNIVSITGGEMKTAASAVLNVLFTANPASVGGNLPGDDLYAE
ncbi:MAG: ABC transporter substrate-binding protein [Clostridiales bacterium]|nr:ABC transporter substrate-binding protein [Clostridiales bacterium]